MSARAYQETQVLTAPPQQLHLIVIDGAVRYAQLGLQAMEQGDRETSHAALNRSREFTNELLAGLRADADPDMIERLKQLFLFVIRKLTFADLHQEPEQIRHALRILQLHRETWEELLQTLARSVNVPPPHSPWARTPPPPEQTSSRSWST